MIRILDDLGYPHFSKRPTNDDVFLKIFWWCQTKVQKQPWKWDGMTGGWLGWLNHDDRCVGV
jgi:hypothetical protein